LLEDAICTQQLILTCKLAFGVDAAAKGATLAELKEEPSVTWPCCLPADARPSVSMRLRHCPWRVFGEPLADSIAVIV
jgi:hypothetical protein